MLERRISLAEAGFCESVRLVFACIHGNDMIETRDSETKPMGFGIRARFQITEIMKLWLHVTSCFEF